MRVEMYPRVDFGCQQSLYYVAALSDCDRCSLSLEHLARADAFLLQPYVTCKGLLFIEQGSHSLLRNCV